MKENKLTGSGLKHAFARCLHMMILAGLLTLAGGAFSAAFAHSFNTVLILPEATAGITDLEQAFLLASQERDSHAQEESDGHLGGLDVYLTFANEFDKNAIASAAADVIAAPLSSKDTDLTLAEFALGLGAVVLTAPDLEAPGAQALLARAADPSLPPFATRFRAATGRAPGPEAKAVYVTARQISQAVRAAGGVDDLALLRSLLAK